MTLGQPEKQIKMNTEEREIPLNFAVRKALVTWKSHCRKVVAVEDFKEDCQRMRRWEARKGDLRNLVVK